MTVGRKQQVPNGVRKAKFLRDLTAAGAVIAALTLTGASLAVAQPQVQNGTPDAENYLTQHSEFLTDPTLENPDDPLLGGSGDPNDTPQPDPDLDLNTNPNSTPAPEFTDENLPPQGVEGKVNEDLKNDLTGDDEQSADDNAISLFADDDDEVPPPYLTWTVRDTQGNLVPGAKFNLQGPREGSTNNNNDARWNHHRANDIVDCIEAPCTGPDQDPTPGVFKVQSLGGQTVDPTGRYRLQRTTATVPGYSWISNTGWAYIPGTTTNSNTAQNGAWQNQTYDFGVYNLQPYQPSCAAGYVYGISDSGQIMQVAPDGTVTSIGGTPNRPGPGTNSQANGQMNGLGIGQGGGPVYAYNRYGSQSANIAIWEFDTTTGTWSDTGAAATTTDVYAVAGAVCQCTGAFFFGGFQRSGTGTGQNGARFHLWMYNPATNVVTKVGYISTPGGSRTDGNNNGDLVFDASGNMYLVRSTTQNGTNAVTVFSVSGDSMRAATQAPINSNQQIPASQSNTYTNNIPSAVNGVAFDSNGNAFLGNGTSITRFDMPLWNNPVSAITGTGFSASTDLASCSAPPSITLRKNVVERKNTGDQFTLTLAQGNNTLSTNTTTGNNTGTQVEQAGPTVVMRGESIDFSEAFVPPSSSGDYRTTYQCWATNRTPLTPDEEAVSVVLKNGTGTASNLKIPVVGELGFEYTQYVCEFTNDPRLPGSITWEKVDDGTPATLLAGSEWKLYGPPGDLGAPSFEWVVTDCVVPGGGACPSDSIDKDPAAGKFKVEELPQGSGYKLVETKAPDGYVLNPAPIVFDIPTNTTLDVFLGQIVNQRNTGTAEITLRKETQDVGAEEYLPASGWAVEVTENEDNPVTGPANEVTGSDGSAGPWIVEFDDASKKAEVTVSETIQTGYEFADLQCVNSSENELTVSEPSEVEGSVSADLSGIGAGDHVTCTFQNKQLPGQVSWQKVDASEEPKLLAGSEWSLTGPSVPANTIVTDCVGANEAACGTDDFADKNPAAGKFKLDGLQWGTYTLKETKAPAGYQRTDIEYSFTVGANNLDGATITAAGDNPDPTENNIQNAQRPGPNMPLTGGLSAFGFVLVGGGILGTAAIGAILLQRRRANQAG